ncbi:MAG: glycosyltransferase [Clostridia bacterium]|nr:glycosyltransferase [Clostridia bacterium]
MKILQVNCVYNKGSTGKIMYDIHTGLIENQIDSVICYGRGAKTTDKNVYKTCGELYSKLNNLMARITGLMYGGCFFSTNKLISIIKKEKPDIVHLHCINGYFVNIYRLVSWLNKNKVKTVLTLHAEFMHTANCGYALECEKWKSGCGKCPRLKKETKSILFDRTADSFKKMKKAFEGFENVIAVSVSPWLMERAKLSPIMEKLEHAVVLNGLNTEVFHTYNTDDLREKYGLTGKKVVFHATSGFSTDKNHIKGGYYLIELAKLLPNVEFLIAGNRENIDVPPNVRLLGMLSNQEELAKHYAMADLTVIASKKETFSMITAESLCCGTPVVGFKAGGPESITIEDYSSLVDYGDLESLCKATKDFLDKEFDKEQISNLAKDKYSKINMANNYLEIYKKLYEREDKKC